MEEQNGGQCHICEGLTSAAEVWLPPLPRERAALTALGFPSPLIDQHAQVCVCV